MRPEFRNAKFPKSIISSLIPGSPAMQSLTVSEYSRQFFERTVSKAYAADAEDNQKLAGQNFVSKLARPYFGYLDGLESQFLLALPVLLH